MQHPEDPAGEAAMISLEFGVVLYNPEKDGTEWLQSSAAIDLEKAE